MEPNNDTQPQRNLTGTFDDCFMEGKSTEASIETNTGGSELTMDDRQRYDRHMETAIREYEHEQAVLAEFGDDRTIDDVNDPREDLAGEDFEQVASSRKMMMQELVNRKGTVTGVQITRTINGNSRFHPKDIRQLFEILVEVDKHMLIMDCAGNRNNIFHVKDMCKMTPMDYNGFLDIQSIQWGHPDDNLMRTTLSFWIATHNIKRNLFELKDHPKFKQFLQAGNCRVQPTSLLQSQSRLIGLVEGKDPKHTHNRTELADRISSYLSSHSQKYPTIPVNIVQVTELGVPILAIAVGNRHATAATKILTDHPYSALGIIMMSWKRQAKEEFATRINQHQLICQQSRAFRISSMDPAGLGLFQEFIRYSTADPYVIDISTAVHSETTGRVYVQYLEVYKEQVQQILEEYIADHKNPPDSTFGHPTIDNSDSATIANNTFHTNKSDNQSRTTITRPQSKYANLLTSQPKSVHKPVTTRIPKAITTTKPKSFMAALTSSMDSDSDDTDHSTLTPRTKGSGKSSKGKSKATATEERLAKENQDLREELGQMKQRLADMERTHKQQMSELMDMVRQMKSQMEDQALANPSPTRKQPPSKKTNTQETPNKSITGNLLNRARNIGQQLSEVVAPHPQAAQIQDMTTTTIPPEVGQSQYV